MSICNTKTAQTDQARPAVATRGSILGPNGPQNGQKPNPKNLIFGPLPILPYVTSRTGWPLGRPKDAKTERVQERPSDPAPFPSFLPIEETPTGQGRPSEAAGGPSRPVCLSILSVWLPSVCLALVCLSGLSGWLVWAVWLGLGLFLS